MFNSFEPYLAFRYLRSKRKEVFISIITLISIVGVALSVIVLDMVMSVMTGFEKALQEKLVDANAHVIVRSQFGNLENYQEVIDKVLKIEGVKAAYPYSYTQVMVTSDAGSRGIILRGITDEKFTKEKLLKVSVQETSYHDLFKPAEIVQQSSNGEETTIHLPPIIIGKSLGEKLGLLVGSPITIFTPSFSASPQGVAPRMKRFVVIDKYHSGLVEYESGLAYISLEDAKRYFKMGEGVTGIEVAVNNLDDAVKIAAVIRNSLIDTVSALHVSDWTEQNKPLWDAIQLEKRVYFIVLLLLILVASFSIVSTLVMLVMEKSKDIAVLKTLGASDKSILKIFLIQGAVIGFIGILFGTIFGYFGCIALREYGFKINEEVFSLSEVPVHVDPVNILIVAIAAFIITAASGIYPAFRAAKIKPAEALRFE